MELARLLRRFDDPPEVVFLTGHADAAVEAFEVQALDFLVKPVSRERLDAALERIEGSRRRRRRGAARTAAAAAPRDGRPEVVAVDNPKGAESGSSASRRSRSRRPTATTRASSATTGDFLLRTPLGQLEKDWGRAGSCASTARTSSTWRTRSSCARSSTAPPC